MEAAHIVPLVSPTNGIIPNKLQESVYLLYIRPSLYTLMQKAAILNIRRLVRNFLVE